MLFAKVLAKHAVHTLTPPPEYKAASQFLHALLPAKREKVPGTQARQAPEVRFVKVPGSHREGAVVVCTAVVAVVVVRRVVTVVASIVVTVVVVGVVDETVVLVGMPDEAELIL